MVIIQYKWKLYTIQMKNDTNTDIALFDMPYSHQAG